MIKENHRNFWVLKVNESNFLSVEKPKIVFLLLSFIGYFSQKVMDYVEIYAGNWEKIIK